MALRLVTDVTAEPCTLADLKTFIGLSTVSTVEDGLLMALEKAARQYCENYTHKPCLPQVWQLTLNDWPDGDEIVIPFAPLSCSTEDIIITYLDAVSGESTTLSSTNYVIDHLSEPGRITLSASGDWPDVFNTRNPITVQFVAGFRTDTVASPSTDKTPEDIETWIKMRVKAMYETRESFGDKQIYEMPHSFIDGLLDRHVLIDVRP